MKTKNIKVLYSSRYSQSGGILRTGSGPCCTVPKIQMEGKWLEALGFSIGTPLIVEYEEGSIRIRTLTAEELAAKEQREAQAELECMREAAGSEEVADEELAGLSVLEVFDRERLKMLIEKVVVYGADAVEIVWKVGNPFRGENSA